MKVILRKMELTSYLFATATCLVCLASLAIAANEVISYGSAAQYATAFTIQVRSSLCILIVIGLFHASL